MKTLRIVFLLAFLVLAGAWLSASESVVLENEQPVLTPKTAQADTIRMTWVVESTSSSFSFRGEKGATYKVEWGDGKTQTIRCSESYFITYDHTYSNPGTYTVLLYGVSK